MAKLLKLRRGTTTQHSSFTGAEGEVTVDTDKETLVVHDGSTAGGHPVAAEDLANVSSSTIAGRLSNDSIAVSKIAAGNLPSDVKIQSANITDATIVNADINASAAIAGTKISPNFGSQNITTTGQLTIAGSLPTILLNDENDENDFEIHNDNGIFKVRDIDAGSDRLIINSAGNTTFAGNLNANSGLDVTGDITNTGSITSNGTLTIENSAPGISLNDTGDNPDWQLKNENGLFRLRDTTSSVNRLTIASGGQTTISGNLDCSSGVDVTGNITVTGTVDGRDVASDGSKLDGIESGATADQSASEILTAIKTVDGSGSGLDADTLDGMQPSTTSSTNTIVQRNASGYIFVNYINVSPNDVSSNITKICCEQNNDGYVRHATAAGVRSFINVENGATADQTGAEIAPLLDGQNIYTTQKIGRNSSDYIQWSPNTHIDFYVNGNNEFRMEADGDFHADGDITAQSTTISSDRKLKENIEVIPNALDKVQALNGVSFDWKKTGEKSAGVIAQEVQGVLPEAVKEVTPVAGGDSHLSVNYHALTSILIESIKELKAEIEELKGGK